MFWKLSAINHDTGEDINLTLQANDYSKERILSVMEEVHPEWDCIEVEQCPEDWKPSYSHYGDGFVPEDEEEEVLIEKKAS